MEGTPFGRYRLLDLLGRGGMGEVWRTHDTDTDRIVAIKLLPAHFSDNEEYQRRFRREAHAAARLNTPHAVPIHNYGEIDGRLYVDMRLIEGRDLHTVLAEGPLDPARAVRIIEGVAVALHAAHQVGLLHRDVKPSNILLDRNDFAYLIDFGIARALDETRMTKTGHPPGTFQYIAPERLGSRAEEDARADIYSLACVLYECLTGQPPFAGDTMAQLVAAHLSTPPPRPSTTRPNVPAQMDEVIATGMAKDPDQRYATTVELANAAHDAITTPLAPSSEPGLPHDAPPATPTPARPTRHDEQVRPKQPPAPQPVWQQPADLNLAATQQRPPGWPPAPPPGPTDRPPPTTGTPPRQPWWRRRAIVIPAALLTVAVVAAAIVITSQQHQNFNGPQITLPTSQTQTAQPAPSGPTAQPAPPVAQTVLPFTGIDPRGGVAVDAADTVYVADSTHNRVLKLAAGSSTQEVLPFDLNSPKGLAVDSAGNLYVADGANHRVVKLAARSSTQEVLPFTGLNDPVGVAVDTAGNLYVTDQIHFSRNGKVDRVVKLAAGSNTQTVLPFTGLNYPSGVAVDTAGNLYVADTNNKRVLTLAARSDTPTVLPVTGLKFPWDVAVDKADNLYVLDSDNSRVLKRVAGSNTQTVLPFTGLDPPYVAVGVAVDAAGNVYVTGKGQVLKLPAG